MKLEVGQKYVTRDGRAVTIIWNDKDATSGVKPFLGLYSGGDYIARWMSDGRYQENRSCPEELVRIFGASIAKFKVGDRVVPISRHSAYGGVYRDAR